MKKIIGLVSFLWLFSLVSFAQEVKKGVVEVNKDSLIDRLQQQRVQLIASGDEPSMNSSGSMVASNAKPGVPLKTGKKLTARGYRVQIYSGSSRSEAYSAQARFKQIYSDLNTYLSYEQPNYRVKVGDFTSRAQAQGLMNQLKRDFSAVFIFTETINIEY